MYLLCKNMLKKVLVNSKRYYTTTKANGRVLELLTDRTLFKLTGKDTVDLLQGLVTNDVKKLSNDGVGSLYTLFLNVKGRVMYDAILYKIPGANSYLLEIDKAISTSIQRHLNIYRLRKDVKIENVSNELNLWVNFNPELLTVNPRENMDMFLPKATSKLPSESAIVLDTKDGEVIEYFDPRTSLLGSRIISHKNTTNVVYDNYGEENTKLYTMFRYRLGIGEGVVELPIGKCLPLEANCDYLNGISFNKGCYLGQELTARSYHTGVIRKRYMPLFLNGTNVDDIKNETITYDGKNVGILRGTEKNLGLALLRLAEVENKTLTVDCMEGFTMKPIWWPREEAKEASVN